METILSLWRDVSSNPIWLLSLPLLILAGLGWGLKIFPTRLLVLLAALPFIVSLGLFWRHDVVPWLVSLDAVLVLVATADLISLPRKQMFSAQRETPRIASLRKPHEVSVSVANHDRRPHVISMRDSIPDGFVSNRDFERVALAARSRAVMEYSLQCTRRGLHRMSQLFLKVFSRLGLWQRFLTYDVENELHVYPDMQQLEKYALLARTNRLSLMGVQRRRRIGQDNEFERLRDYTRDDQFKHIDWRSTARRNKLTVRDFQSNQSQRVIFLVDCGRMMVNRAAGLALLDHAFNSMLMLSHVALRQGDAVGMLTFSDRVHNFVLPRGGGRQMNLLLHAAFDRFPRLVESRYDQAFLHLSRNCRKRSLVILMTNVIDQVNADQLRDYLATTTGRHLPLCVLLRDHRVFDLAERTPATPTDRYQSAAAASILTWRHHVLTQLQHQGVLVVDTFPETLTAPLVNRYLEIKARHLL